MRRPAPLRRPLLAVILVGVLVGVVLSACSSRAHDIGGSRGPAPGVGQSPLRSFGTYAALGDSYTAGPLVATTDLANGCFRSDHDYPKLVAERLDVRRLVDVSCSGADTSDLAGRQHTLRNATVPPQLRAVGRGTDLVTLGIGGNDFGLFGTLVGTCAQVRGQDPSGAPCEAQLRARGVDLVAATNQISLRVASALREIRQRAPHATVLLVGYLRLVPSRGQCKALPLARGDYAFGDRVSRALDDALARAARRTGVRFVDMYAASRGHDVCSRDPWVNGATTVQGKALAFHPLASGMGAVADQVVKALAQKGPAS